MFSQSCVPFVCVTCHSCHKRLRSHRQPSIWVFALHSSCMIYCPCPHTVTAPCVMLITSSGWMHSLSVTVFSLFQMVQAIQVLRFHLLELEKVRRLSEPLFCPYHCVLYGLSACFRRQDVFASPDRWLSKSRKLARYNLLLCSVYGQIGLQSGGKKGSSPNEGKYLSGKIVRGWVNCLAVINHPVRISGNWVGVRYAGTVMKNSDDSLIWPRAGIESRRFVSRTVHDL